ncbi:MAG TPA: hypothetical protein VNS79_08580 [Sphingobium sp.]|nr:hypothetical protein [Sphingobium sp.]
MFRKFLDDGYWFLPKRYGYGAGLPIAWQGWVVLGAYLAALLGLALVIPALRGAAQAGAVILALLLTAALIAITRRRTRGGWRWRWGEDD